MSQLNFNHASLRTIYTSATFIINCRFGYIDRMGRVEEEKVRSWGFDRVFTWSDGPYISLP